MAPPRKPKLNRKSTMAATAEAGKEVIGNEELGDTRQDTKEIKKAKKSTQPKKSKLVADISEKEDDADTGNPVKLPKDVKSKSPKIKKGSLKAKKGSRKGAKKAGAAVGGKDEKKTSKRGAK